jgi:phosphocarrier protein
MGLMMLAAGPGTELTLVATGADAAAALDAIAALIAARFDED